MNEEKKIIADNFKIEKNIISFNDSLLQISNISNIDVESVPKPQFHLWPIALFIVGLSLVIASEEKIKLIGLLLILGVMIYIIWYVLYNMNNDDKYLCIYLNSGQVYYICCENKKFLKKVMRVIKYCINNHTPQEIKIDFDQCTLENVPINIGNNKEVINAIVTGDNSGIPINIYEKPVINSTVTGDNPKVSFIIEDWSLVQYELRKACENLPKTSKEYMASKEALACALKEDEDGLIKVLNKHADSFLSSVFKGVVSGVLVELVKSMLL